MCVCGGGEKRVPRGQGWGWGSGARRGGGGGGPGGAGGGGVAACNTSTEKAALNNTPACHTREESRPS